MRKNNFDNRARIVPSFADDKINVRWLKAANLGAHLDLGQITLWQTYPQAGRKNTMKGIFRVEASSFAQISVAIIIVGDICI
jgi:hypothetical protein